MEAIVNPVSCLTDKMVEVMTPEGTLLGVSYQELKAMCFVTEAAKPDLFEAHPFFERRPKAPGLWTRFTFRDGSRLDGVLSHNLLDWPEHGYYVTPPFAGPLRQRVFIPRRALTHTELRGVVGTSAAVAMGRRKAEEPRQLPMFD